MKKSSIVILIVVIAISGCSAYLYFQWPRIVAYQNVPKEFRREVMNINNAFNTITYSEIKTTFYETLGDESVGTGIQYSGPDGRYLKTFFFADFKGHHIRELNDGDFVWKHSTLKPTVVHKRAAEKRGISYARNGYLFFLRNVNFDTMTVDTVVVGEVSYTRMTCAFSEKFRGTSGLVRMTVHYDPVTYYPYQMTGYNATGAVAFESTYAHVNEDYDESLFVFEIPDGVIIVDQDRKKTIGKQLEKRVGEMNAYLKKARPVPESLTQEIDALQEQLATINAGAA